MRNRSRTLVALAALVTAALCTVPALAQTPPVQYVYAVNFECGFQVSDIGVGGYEPLVKVANYATKVDFHNYDLYEAQIMAEVYSTANNRWTATGAPQPIPAGTMPINSASVIDCNHIVTAIQGAVPAGKPFLSGMVRIVSDQELVVWTTKTTQVCSGLAKLDTGEAIVPPLSYDIGSGLIYRTSTGLTEAVDLSMFGCPAAEIDGGTGQTPYPPTIPGTFRGPNGGVPPGLRPIPGAIRIDYPGSPNPQFMFTNVSVSHSMDFERVEGVCIND